MLLVNTPVDGQGKASTASMADVKEIGNQIDAQFAIVTSGNEALNAAQALGQTELSKADAALMGGIKANITAGNEGISDSIKKAWEAIKKFFSKMWGKVKGVFGNEDKKDEEAAKKTQITLAFLEKAVKDGKKVKYNKSKLESFFKAHSSVLTNTIGGEMNKGTVKKVITAFSKVTGESVKTVKLVSFSIGNISKTAPAESKAITVDDVRNAGKSFTEVIGLTDGVYVSHTGTKIKYLADVDGKIETKETDEVKIISIAKTMEADLNPADFIPMGKELITAFKASATKHLDKSGKELEAALKNAGDDENAVKSAKQTIADFQTIVKTVKAINEAIRVIGLGLLPTELA